MVRGQLQDLRHKAVTAVESIFLHLRQPEQLTVLALQAKSRLLAVIFDRTLISAFLQPFS